MNKIYAICSREALQDCIDIFHPGFGSHCIDLPDGRVLVTCAFAHEGGEMQFGSTPTVELLPDPIFESSKELKPEHLAALSHLNLEGKTILDVARAAGKIHPGMKLRVFL